MLCLLIECIVYCVVLCLCCVFVCSSRVAENSGLGTRVSGGSADVHRTLRILHVYIASITNYFFYAKRNHILSLYYYYLLSLSLESARIY